MTSRRNFLKHTSLAIGATYLASWLPLKSSAQRFKLSHNPGAIGVQLSSEELLEAAKEYGFQAIAPQLAEIESWSTGQLNDFKETMTRETISWDAAGLPVEFRQSEDKFTADYQKLRTILPKLERLGIERMSTWIMPCHDDLNYEQNMELHAARLRKTAHLLADHKIRLGLEYVGPLTLKQSKRYPFVSNLAEVKELISAIGAANVGVQLDAFHWYCAGENQKDLLSLKAENIVTVDLNDAKAGRSRAAQLDWERELPGESGVIDLKLFLQALDAIGYDGPIRAEPFNAKLNEMENDAALRVTSKAMHAAIKLID